MVWFYIVCILIIISILGVMWFSRFPSQSSIQNNPDTINAIIAPSYGTIKEIIYNDNILHIMIYLSPRDIHVQFLPIAGIITEQIYDRTGKFNLAYKIGKSRYNEKMITILETPMLNTPIAIYQVAGYLTRHIHSYVKKDELVQQSQALGRIDLGSRVDIIIPFPKANGVKLNCSVEDKLIGGKTPIILL